MIEIHPGWIVAAIAFAVTAAMGSWLWATRRSAAAAGSAATELVELHRAGAVREADADLAAAKAAGAAAIAETGAQIEKEIIDAVSDGGFADTFNSWPRDS